MFSDSFKLIGGICIGFVLFTILIGYDRGGSADVYQEAKAYIWKDAEAHPQNISMETTRMAHAASFYGYNELPLYISGDDYDVLYFNPLHKSEEQMYSEIAALGIDRDRVLRIHVNNYKSVFKIYSGVPYSHM
ncbi:MAG: hypothetical protein LBQ89_01595 [Treponema sp.]|nr:hypothetical protein [Treponema sp.]